MPWWLVPFPLDSRLAPRPPDPSFALPFQIRQRMRMRILILFVALFIQIVALHWQRDSGYNERARVEGQFARWKKVIGDGLRFHGDEARAIEVAIATQVLNRMLDLGCPNSVRVA